MGDDLSDYEEQRLEIERKKLEALQGIKKALKHQSRMQSVQDLMDRMDVDRDDIETIAGLVASHIGSGKMTGRDNGWPTPSRFSRALQRSCWRRPRLY
ncbi:MAG: hypothetical protein SVU32_07795 [Candidatus Nanohaloarchaea archaeon]|nr:hypothetical protein [Candidatus Nanohaloarchaea archaeon]